MYFRNILVVCAFLTSTSASYAGYTNYTSAKGVTAPLFNTAISGVRQITLLVILILAIPVVAKIIRIIFRERKR